MTIPCLVFVTFYTNMRERSSYHVIQIFLISVFFHNNNSPCLGSTSVLPFLQQRESQTFDLSSATSGLWWWWWGWWWWWWWWWWWFSKKKILKKKCDFMDFVFSIVSIVKLWSGNWATAVLFNEYKVAPLVAPPCWLLKASFMLLCSHWMSPVTVSQKYPATKSIVCGGWWRCLRVGALEGWVGEILVYSPESNGDAIKQKSNHQHENHQHLLIKMEREKTSSFSWVGGWMEKKALVGSVIYIIWRWRHTSSSLSSPKPPTPSSSSSS